MPCELFQAFDLTPLCAEMLAMYIASSSKSRLMIEKAEGSGISETYCSFHKIVMGAGECGLFEGLAGIVNCSLACDADNLTYRVLSHKYFYPQYYLDVPYGKSESSVEYVVDQLHELCASLENLAGKKLDEEKLKEICARSRKTKENFRRIMEYRKNRTLHQSMKSYWMEMCLIKNMCGTPEALEYSERKLREWEKAEEYSGHKLVWMHCMPFLCSSVKDIVEANDDLQIAVTELGSDALFVSDSNDLFRSMAESLVYDSYNGSCYDRTAHVVKLAELAGADGAVCFCQWGCKQTCGASVLMKEAIEKNGYPVLLLNGDAADYENSPDGQISTRLGAFAEMLREKSI